MRFLADMGISWRTVEWLRQQGHDATHLREEGLQRLPDDQILEKARKEQRIVLTMDLEFGYLLAVSRGQLPSVIIFRLNDERAERVNASLGAILSQSADDLDVGAVVSANEWTHRLRRLPIAE